MVNTDDLVGYNLNSIKKCLINWYAKVPHKSNKKIDCMIYYEITY